MNNKKLYVDSIFCNICEEFPKYSANAQEIDFKTKKELHLRCIEDMHDWWQLFKNCNLLHLRRNFLSACCQDSIYGFCKKKERKLIKSWLGKYLLSFFEAREQVWRISITHMEVISGFLRRCNFMPWWGKFQKCNIHTFCVTL